MFGLVVLLVIGVYLLISFAIVRWLVGYARKKGKSAKRWGWSAALVMFLIPFWDWIPTVATHKYYCETEAGFWVYKTREHWDNENPMVMQTLVYIKEMPFIQTPYGAGTMLNQRIISIYKHEGPLLINRWRMTSELRDLKTGEVIAREVRFSTSQERRQAGWSGWKFWLDNERCKAVSHRDQGSFDKITLQFEGAGK